jgi:hypothetical protein
MNIPFYYLNESSPVPDQIYTNLKWSDLRQEQDKSRLNHFISALLQIAALEIQARGGAPSKVNLVYFFPSSMDWKRQEELTKAWKAAYSRYFGTSGGFVQALSESVAPYQYFAYAEPSIINGKNVINCDIGGGTCDAYIHYRGTTTPEMPKIASFRFGGNAVFGDGYDTNKGKKNGFIGACKDAVENKLGEGSSSDHRTTRDAYQQLKDRAISSEEMISFFQSLSNRDMHKEVYFDFNEHVNLHRPQLNLVYLIYFGGIIYHLLEVTKSMGIDRPTNITFTGNGSKILQALASDRILSVIANYLAEGVYGEGEGGADALSIKTFEKPKDYTSLGGLAMIKNKEQLDTEFTPPQNVVVLGIDEQMSGKDMYFVREGGQIVGEAPNYGKVLTGGDYEQKTVANVERFLDILFDVNRKFSFKANLGLDIRDMEGAKAEIKSYLSMGYTYGVEERIEQGNATQAVEETLFFHPLRNAIYNLGMTLAKRVL